MKAIVRQSAEPSDLALTEVPAPEMGDNELLVRVFAVGVGIHDEYFYPPTAQFPYVIGIEAAGVVEKTGNRVRNHRVGERVAFVSAMQPKGGTWAEYAVVTQDSLIVRIPDGMSFENGAAIPVAGNTVLKAFHALNLRSNASLFIAGASGAIGTFAIQLAVQRGYSVAASASQKNHDYMLALGAQKTVDYHDPDWPEQVRQWQPGGVDAAIAIQPGTAFDSLSVVKEGGEVVTISAEQVTPQRDITLKQIAYQADVQTELAELMNNINAGKIQLTVERVYPFVDGLEALQKTKTRHARGKLVLTMG